jgi:ethanolamine utilization protein EutA (predicted chaperonin)
MQQLQQQNIENPVIQVWRYQRVDQKVVFRSRIYDTMVKSKEDKKTINDPQNIT